MTALAITGMGLTGVLRLTWVQDNLAHVLDYSQADETSGTWPGLPRPRPGPGRRRGQRGATGNGRRERARRPDRKQRGTFGHTSATLWRRAARGCG